MTVAQPPPARRPPSPRAAEGLIQRLGEALAAHDILACQWKGHRKRDRWLSGEGDIDLLVARTAAAPLAHVLGTLGFKRVAEPAWLQVGGVESHLGHDPQLGRLVHVHVHYRLVLGQPWTTTFVLPIEPDVLDASRPGFVFRVPAPEHELVLLVARLALQCTARNVLLRRSRARRIAAERELTQLEEQVSRTRLVEFLARRLPGVDAALFDRCRRALRPDQSAWSQYRAGRHLRARLAPFARPPRPLSVLMALAEWLGERIGYRCRRAKRLPAGGVVALLGGDGSGKTTCAHALTQWLSPEIATLHVHLGRPPRSLLTCAVGAALKLSLAWDRLRGRPPHRESAGGTDYLDLLRHACTARDRHRLYRAAQRFAAAGGVVIAERYPVPENYFLVGPSAAQGLGTPADDRLTRLLRRWETRYYDLMRRPDAPIVLRLEPEEAVRRKPEEPPDYVRERARVVWRTDWQRVGAHVIHVDRALPEVLGDLKSLVWTLV